MSVGSIKGGGSRGGPKGPGGAAPKGGAGKAGSFGKVDRSEPLAAASREVGSAEVSGPAVLQEAERIAQALRSGEIASKEAAARELVAFILRGKLRTRSKALEARIADELQGDPRLAQTLARIWQKR